MGVAACTLGTGEAQRLWGAGTEGQQAAVGLLGGGLGKGSHQCRGFTPSVNTLHQQGVRPPPAPSFWLRCPA